MLPSFPFSDYIYESKVIKEVYIVIRCGGGGGGVTRLGKKSEKKKADQKKIYYGICIFLKNILEFILLIKVFFIKLKVF